MENFQFILKSVGFSFLIALIIGALAGFTIDFFRSPHPHQIIPTFMISAIISLIAGFIISLIISGIMIWLKNLNLKLELIIFAAIIIISNIIFIIKSIYR